MNDQMILEDMDQILDQATRDQEENYKKIVGSIENCLGFQSSRDCLVEYLIDVKTKLEEENEEQQQHSKRSYVIKRIISIIRSIKSENWDAQPCFIKEVKKNQHFRQFVFGFVQAQNTYPRQDKDERQSVADYQDNLTASGIETMFRPSTATNQQHSEIRNFQGNNNKKNDKDRDVDFNLIPLTKHTSILNSNVNAEKGEDIMDEGNNHCNKENIDDFPFVFNMNAFNEENDDNLNNNRLSLNMHMNNNSKGNNFSNLRGSIKHQKKASREVQFEEECVRKIVGQMNGENIQEDNCNKGDRQREVFSVQQQNGCVQKDSEYEMQCRKFMDTNGILFSGDAQNNVGFEIEEIKEDLDTDEKQQQEYQQLQKEKQNVFIADKSWNNLVQNRQRVENYQNYEDNRDKNILRNTGFEENMRENEQGRNPYLEKKIQDLMGSQLGFENEEFNWDDFRDFNQASSSSSSSRQSSTSMLNLSEEEIENRVISFSTETMKEIIQTYLFKEAFQPFQASGCYDKHAGELRSSAYQEIFPSCHCRMFVLTPQHEMPEFLKSGVNQNKRDKANTNSFYGEMQSHRRRSSFK